MALLVREINKHISMPLMMSRAAKHAE